MVFPYAPSYREGIYKRMDEEFDCSYYFCENPGVNLNLLNYSCLKKCDASMLRHKLFGGAHFFTKVPLNEIKKCKHVVMPGNPHNLTVWLLLLYFRLFRSKKNRTYLWTHGVYGRESKIEYRIKKLFFSLADGLLLYGEYAADLIREKKLLKEKKIHVLYNSLDYQEQLKRRGAPTQNPFKEHFKNDNANIIFIGRLTQEKKLDLIIRAITNEQNPLRYLNVTFVGTGEDEDRLKKVINESGISDRVWFYGKCFKEDEISVLMNHADLCVSPGNVGLTAIHCMTYGVPVISHNDFPHQGPEFESIKPNQTGDFFRPDDADDLNRVINEWFKSHNDTARVKQECYKIIDSYYNPDYQIRVLKNLFKSV